MPGGAALLIDCQLREDDVLDRCQPDRFTTKNNLVPPGEPPVLNRIFSRAIDVRPKPRVMMGKIEVAEGGASSLLFDDFERRDLELVTGKCGRKVRSVFGLQSYDEIDVLGVSWLAVDDRCDAFDNHVGNIELRQRADEPGDKLRE
jgi:hypothetical protein